MNKILNILIIGLQIILTFIVTVGIYMLLALLDSDFGIDGLFGLFVIQPIIAIIISSLTITGCLILGLPIRLNKKINDWWIANFYFSIIGFLVGLMILFISFLPMFKDTITVDVDGEQTIKQVPNLILIIGYFLISFSLIHLYPPRQLTDKIKMIF
jgi:hypothetical protein